MLGTAPISKAPYWMAPVKLRELRAQLLELMVKGLLDPESHLGEHLHYRSVDDGLFGLSAEVDLQ